MKTECTKNIEFSPVTISITFESQKELNMWLEMRGSVNWINVPKYTDFFVEMFPVNTAYFNLLKVK